MEQALSLFHVRPIRKLMRLLLQLVRGGVAVTDDKLPSPTTDADHFRQLDFQIQEDKKEMEALAIEKNAKALRIQAEADLIKVKEWRTAREHFRWFLWWLFAVLVLAGSGWGIYSIATSGPPKSPEQVVEEHKQDRFKDCVQGTNVGGEKDNIWYPNANDGAGQCLPKDKPPPEEK